MKLGCNSGCGSGCLKFCLLPLGLTLLFGGFFLQSSGFDKIQDMRKMERIPHVDVIAVIPGEVSMQGQAASAGRTIKGKYSGRECFFVYWLEEERRTDSEGDTYWATIDQGSRHAGHFLLKDNTGAILVSLSGVSPDLQQDYKNYRGDRRYTEWRIDEGQNVFAFALAQKRPAPRQKNSPASGSKSAAVSEGLMLTFTKSGSYVPILSEYTALQARKAQGTNGILMTLGSALCFIFGILCICFLMKVHRVLIFLSIVSTLNLLVLFFMGLNMMHSDLKDGYERLDRHEESAREAVQSVLESKFEWSSLPQRVSGLPNAKSARALGIRNDLSASIERSNAIRERFPESWLAPMWGIDPKPSILAPGEQRSAEAEIIPSPISAWLGWIGGAVALIVGGVGSVYGFKRIKIKRYIENVPTSLSSGLAYGPAEIQGQMELIEDRVLTGPLSKKKCAYFRYKVTETRGSGKNRRTVTIEDRKDAVPFFCKDREGSTLVDPKGAEISAPLVKSRRSGRRTYQEWSLLAEQDLYILGSAEVEPVEGVSLQLSEGRNDDFPFLISGFTEKETMLAESGKGLFLVSCGFSGIVMLVLLLFASTGSYAATDFLFSSFTAPFFLIFSTFGLMFNDLVFLRNRVKRAWANIEVSLKKRVDLIPNLEAVAQAYLQHEKEVHLGIAELRNAVHGKTSFAPSDFEATMQVEIALTTRLIALAEAYPKLKGETLMRELMTSLTRMENEVALMRAGYNDSVELYRSTKSRIPEVILAKLFKFEDAQFLKTEMKVYTLPEIGFGNPVSSARESSSDASEENPSS